MLLNFILLVAALAVVVKSAGLAINYSSELAKNFGFSKYLVGFLIVAVISVLPEAFISVAAALSGQPAFGLGTLFGSNIADLALIFALVILFSGRGLKVESKILHHASLYIVSMTLTVILGWDGHYSRLEGLSLIVLGLTFYSYILGKSPRQKKVVKQKFQGKNLFGLLVSMGLLLLGSHYAVAFGLDLAKDLGVNPVLIGMFAVALGTTLPELMFCIKASRQRHDGLVLGDLLGTVLTDATILVGLLALISPFSFNPGIIYISGLLMILAAVLLFRFMKTGRTLTQKEALLLILFYLSFVVMELLVNGRSQ